MKRIYSIFEAKAKLSEIIRIVREKHEVVITDRSKPVVKVVPFRTERTVTLADRIEELNRSGHISRQSSIPKMPEQLPLEPGILKRFLQERD